MATPHEPSASELSAMQRLLSPTFSAELAGERSKTTPGAYFVPVSQTVEQDYVVEDGGPALAVGPTRVRGTELTMAEVEADPNLLLLKPSTSSPADSQSAASGQAAPSLPPALPAATAQGVSLAQVRVSLAQVRAFVLEVAIQELGSTVALTQHGLIDSVAEQVLPLATSTAALPGLEAQAARLLREEWARQGAPAQGGGRGGGGGGGGGGSSQGGSGKRPQSKEERQQQREAREIQAGLQGKIDSHELLRQRVAGDRNRIEQLRKQAEQIRRNMESMKKDDGLADSHPLVQDALQQLEALNQQIREIEKKVRADEQELIELNIDMAQHQHQSQPPLVSGLSSGPRRSVS